MQPAAGTTVGERSRKTARPLDLVGLALLCSPAVATGQCDCDAAQWGLGGSAGCASSAYEDLGATHGTCTAQCGPGVGCLFSWRLTVTLIQPCAVDLVGTVCVLDGTQQPSGTCAQATTGFYQSFVLGGIGISVGVACRSGLRSTIRSAVGPLVEW
jgi:hypothetical protein